MTRPGVEPRSPGALANTLISMTICVSVCVCVCVLCDMYLLETRIPQKHSMYSLLYKNYSIQNIFSLSLMHFLFLLYHTYIYTDVRARTPTHTHTHTHTYIYIYMHLYKLVQLSSMTYQLF